MTAKILSDFEFPEGSGNAFRSKHPWNEYLWIDPSSGYGRIYSFNVNEVPKFWRASWYTQCRKKGLSVRSAKQGDNIVLQAFNPELVKALEAAKQQQPAKAKGKRGK
jgi:hypothetical protein